MTSEDLDRFEAGLGFPLPTVYRQLMLDFPQELRKWPPKKADVKDRRDDWVFDADRLLKKTARFRRKIKEDFPEKGVVIGGGSDKWWVIDAAEADPALFLAWDDMLLNGPANLQELLEDTRKSHGAAWAKAIGPKGPTLTPQELLEEGRRLARPAVALQRKGEEYAAVWGKQGVANPGPGEWRHWISIDASFLPQNPRGMTGVVSLYDWFADDDRMGEIKVVNDPNASLPEKPKGTKLFTRRFDCLPDVDALFHFGSDKIQDWARESGWNEDQDYDKTPVKEYLRVIAREHPFQNGVAYAMLGGWSWCFNWCYGIDEEYPWHVFDAALIVLTIENSEPWIEVFDNGTEFETYSRIT